MCKPKQSPIVNGKFAKYQCWTHQKEISQECSCKLEITVQLEYKVFVMVLLYHVPGYTSSQHAAAHEKDGM